MVEELKKLTPAEILLIENPRVDVGKLAKVTLLDLLLNEVLKTGLDKEAEKINSKNPTISIGKAFYTYSPLKHERIFITIYKKDPTIKVKLVDLLKLAFDGIKTTDHFKLSYIYSRKRLGKYFKSSLWQKLLGLKELSSSGEKLQNDIRKELQLVKAKVKRGRLGIEELLLALNSNIILIPKIPRATFEKLCEINANFRKENLKTVLPELNYLVLYGRTGSKEYYNQLAINNTEVNSIIHSTGSFDDSAGDGSDGSADGCGGGCSGCGGCGGCGG